MTTGVAGTGAPSTALLTLASVAGAVAAFNPCGFTLLPAHLVVWAGAGLRSALDSEDIAEGREVAATGASLPRADDRALTFRAAGPQILVDDQTGSTWDVLGTAISGPLVGAHLEATGHLDTSWFAWAAFHPDTRLVGPHG